MESNSKKKIKYILGSITVFFGSMFLLVSGWGLVMVLAGFLLMPKFQRAISRAFKKDKLPNFMAATSALVLAFISFGAVIVDTAGGSSENDFALNQELEKIKNQVADQEESIKTKDQKIQDLESSVSSLEVEKTNLAEQNKSLESEKSELQSQVSKVSESKAETSSSSSSSPSNSSSSDSSSNSSSKAKTTKPTWKYDHSYNKYNCSDFSSWSKADEVYKESLKATGRDIHDLDRDSDGIACENLR